MGKKIKQRKSDGLETEFVHDALIDRGVPLF
jgi:hypothetical protein